MIIYVLQEVTGVSTMEVYTNVLRTLTYLHSDANPGNPTSDSTRYLQHFYYNFQISPGFKTLSITYNITLQGL